MLRVVCLAVLRSNNELLLVRRDNTWMLPSVIVQGDEDAFQCLSTMLHVALPGLSLEDIFPFTEDVCGVFSCRGTAVVSACVYIISSSLSFASQYAGELTGSAWVHVCGFAVYGISDLTYNIIAVLQREGFLLQ
ncbi:MAG: hypothetical protein COU08_02880 [Candidatus Harrisonbacteria bacterium CG10_big_fil_rev_8_21_14_0_10_42_17]|uniref:Nudix hydrolase domain-containing protein n=1 Tax=Candidatus Harrisonbacteria bacterium CG10_big_fil_rev_8_21_14_0_10_42_17 TaxID=1974584 RepID=A0A2M6WHS1_9BACT|nr:MAG: hypothetical protein COU08_02880 [Candidatus Harrisonbacteria bacterium CG10_big_fil_rev_8_21_14_0_10_42_17]